MTATRAVKESYSVWMRVPHEGGRHGWSRVAGDLSQDDAEWMAKALFFEARAMPDQQND